jgi:hypothetical protein
MTFEFVAGVKADSIDSVADRLKSLVGSGYERHDSLYLGEYNRFLCPEPLIVKYNFGKFEGECDEPDFEHLPVLISAAETERPEFFQDVIEKLGLEAEIVRCVEWKAAT